MNRCDAGLMSRCYETDTALCACCGSWLCAKHMKHDKPTKDVKPPDHMLRRKALLDDTYFGQSRLLKAAHLREGRSGNSTTSDYYRVILGLILTKRAFGGVDEVEEDKRLEDLDRLWWMLTDEEQEMIENDLNGERLSCGASMGLVDTVAADNTPPRSAFAGVLAAGLECPNCHSGTIEETETEFACRGECGHVWPKTTISD